MKRETMSFEDTGSIAARKGLDIVIETVTPCDATIEFIREFADNKGTHKQKMIAQCCLYKEHHEGLKHLSPLVQATLGGEQYPNTEGWSFRIEKVTEK